MQLAQNESSAQTNRQGASPLRDKLSKACEVCGNELNVCNSKENYRATQRKCKSPVTQVVDLRTAVGQLETMSDDSTPFPEPVVIEITDVFDLHTIPPRQVKVVVEEYLREAHARGFPVVRIIHGKGIGVQREIVRSVLS